MAMRAANSNSILRYANSSLPAFLCSLSYYRPSYVSRNSKLGLRTMWLDKLIIHDNTLRCSVHSLIESVIEKLEAIHTRKRVRESTKMRLMSSKEPVEDKFKKRVLQKGLLLEFRKDSERVLLAVVQKPDEKNNWMVSDQNGVTSSIKPQQITYIVPGVENFNHSEISNFLQKAQVNLDPTLLEHAWMECLESNKLVTTEELAVIIFGSMEPLESYCAHLLISRDEI
ncbi:ribonuclease II, chloroplastic/mitochondrial-like isoform X2 [Macadamia integrifolia]|uniref:ribonuclease II, chloroplastic/mitochondrial-like isoform X2 n=1 Tax=Macadamia integrifolia TaxID=60698 RepID=UPI001C52ADC6|nr:ribonuclease II, chloroplastic/mitochondrial-like isoform X2 [Macadamia integrifolia]